MIGRSEFKRRGLFTLIVVLLCPVLAGAYTLTCKSKDFNYSMCQTNGRIVRATLKKQLSNSACIYGRSWGYQGYGLWVNHGCQRDFEVTTYGPPAPKPPSPYPPNPFPPYPTPQPEPGPWPDQVPYWAIGRWQSTMPFRGDYRYIQIYPSGSAVYYGPDGPASAYWYRDSIRFYDGGVMNVYRDVSGQIRVDLSSATRLYFRRVG
jgi:Protein of unknown function (DUF3011)